MHHRVEVIWNIEVVCFHFCEVSFCSGPDVFSVDPDIKVSVASTLLVPEAECVDELVLDEALVDASVVKRYLLRPSNSSNPGPTSTSLIDVEVVSLACTRNKADAGPRVELTDGVVNDVLLVGVVAITYSIRHENFLTRLWPFTVCADSCIPCVCRGNISFRKKVSHVFV